MKIIVLGMDNTGKTTLCKKLSEAIHYRIINSTGPYLVKEEVEERLSNLLTSSENLIFERFSPIEEIIYGNTLRGISKFKLEDNIFQTLKTSNHKIIYCRPPVEAILDWKDREQMEGVIEQSKVLIKAWDDFINSLNEQVLIWNYKEDNLYNLISKLGV